MGRSKRPETSIIHQPPTQLTHHGSPSPSRHLPTKPNDRLQAPSTTSKLLHQARNQPILTATILHCYEAIRPSWRRIVSSDDTSSSPHTSGTSFNNEASSI